MTDRLFTHPYAGNEVRIEQYDKEVHLIFVTKSQRQSDSIVENLMKQLEAGMLHITLMGKVTKIEDK
jgi:hypothetical protein